MTTRRLQGERGETPAFIQPFLHALNSIRERESVRPDQFIDRVRTLLAEALGHTEQPLEAAFAHGSIGIQADHTHYFDGFALMMTMRRGMAVAVRARTESTSRLSVEGTSTIHEFDVSGDRGSTPQPALVSFIRTHLLELRTEHDTGLDIAILGSLPPDLSSSFLASVSTALTRAVAALESIPLTAATLVDVQKRAVESYLGFPFSSAFLIGSVATTPDEYMIVDTASGSSLVIPVPDSDRPGWALIDTDRGRIIQSSPEKWVRASEALHRLQDRGFPDLTSFRNLEHQDLEAALAVSGRKGRSMVRFLVTENRRVQRLVGAIRKQDWQLFGALLMMSYACRREDWDSTTPALDYVVDEAERFTMEGVYGAAQTGEGSCAIVVGQPFSVPPFLDHIRSSWSIHTSGELDTFIL
jgi:galactokinase